MREEPISSITICKQRANTLALSKFDTPLGPMVAVGDENSIYMLDFADKLFLDVEMAKLSQLTKSNIRLLWKLAFDSQMLVAYGTEDRSVLNIHEDLSTKAVTQLSAEVEFRERSIVPGDSYTISMLK